MHRIAIWATKGGVGKSTVTAGLAHGLRDLNFKVGAMDLDITSTGLHRAFNLLPDLRLPLDTAAERILPLEIDGVKLFCLAWKLTEDACVGWREEGREATVLGEQRHIPGRRDFLTEILTRTVEWGELDFLLYDLPPSSGVETWVFFDSTPDLHGVIVVSQPSEISIVGLKKTIDFLKREERPILGLVENMAFYLCPHCGQESYPFSSRGKDLKHFAKHQGVPFLGSLPQSANTELLKPYFAQLAETVKGATPRVLKSDIRSLRRRVERGVIKGVLRL